MRLIIAEKPSMGRAIADAIGHAKPVGRTHIVCGDTIVTWCFGHLYEMAAPEYYGERYKQWSLATLPIVPDNWHLIAKKDAAAQISVIKQLLRDASEIVNAGDPDREGQLLVDELLEDMRNRKPTLRLWLPALDEKSVRDALSKLKSNEEYQPLKNSAEARQRADWLVGMNLTRAYTIAGRNAGYNSVLSVGRVQTPTLALVVQRDLEIENFVPKDFYSVKASVNGGTIFTARWRPGPNVDVDEEGRVLSRQAAEGVRDLVSGKPGVVSKYESLDKKQAPPLPFCLSTLQEAANKKLGMSAQEVLDTAQELYEAKLTTYPRSDCPYLPENQISEAPGILAHLGGELGELAKGADLSLKSAAWNDKKLGAHHGIMPTSKSANALSGRAKGLYDMIVRAYLAQFYPDARYKATTIELDLQGEKFVATGKVWTFAGWKVIYGGIRQDDDEDTGKGGDDAQSLPVLTKGQAVQCVKAEVEAKKTTPPPRFTEGTLIKAMANIHQYVTDKKIRETLKENAGIGTEATRANILETLKKRTFIAAKGKQLISTDVGRKLIAALPEQVKSPGLTAYFEDLLAEIAAGKLAMNVFLDKQIKFVGDLVQDVKGKGVAEMGGADLISCPGCKTGHLNRIKGPTGFFWGCSRYREGCKTSFPDSRGKPDFEARKGSSSGGSAPAKMNDDGTRAPSDAMLRVLERAKSEGVSVPDAAFTDFGECRKFLDAHLGGKSGGKSGSRSGSSRGGRRS